MNASLREISIKSGVSTHAIYTRFCDKKGLFDALVKNSADALLAEVKSKSREMERSYELNPDGFALPLKTLDAALEYVYMHLNDFTLIFKMSAGTGYEKIVEELASVEEKTVKRIIKKIATKKDGIYVDDFFIHSICLNGYENIKNVVVSNLTYKQARRFMERLHTFYAAGWKNIIEPE